MLTLYKSLPPFQREVKRSQSFGRNTLLKAPPVAQAAHIEISPPPPFHFPSSPPLPFPRAAAPLEPIRCPPPRVHLPLRGVQTNYRGLPLPLRARVWIPRSPHSSLLLQRTRFRPLFPIWSFWRVFYARFILDPTNREIQPCRIRAGLKGQ